MDKPMTIGCAAKRAGVGVETIRFYERRGLLAQPQRPRDGGYRFYDGEAVERIRFIRQAQSLGFSLREIGDLLSLRADASADCGDVRVKAVEKRAEVDRKIAQLQHIRAALDALIATCPGGGALGACTILDAMAGHAEAKRAAPNTTKERKMKTVVFRVEGMHCDGCARTVQALVSAQAGVQAAAVTFATREARILYDPRAVNAERLGALIRQAGYEAALAPEDRQGDEKP